MVASATATAAAMPAPMKYHISRSVWGTPQSPYLSHCVAVVFISVARACPGESEAALSKSVIASV